MAVKQRTSRASGGARATTDHDEIMSWAEEKGARPVMVRGTGILRLDFPGLSGDDAFEPISWDEFFEKFEQSELAFIYQNTSGTRRSSTFNKLVHRETGVAHGERRTPRVASRAPSRSAGNARGPGKKPSPGRKRTPAPKAKARPSSRSARPVQSAGARRRARPERGAQSRARSTPVARVRSAKPPARTAAPKQLSRKAPPKKRARAAGTQSAAGKSRSR